MMHCWITSRCIACGLCAATCPDIFYMNNDTGQGAVKTMQIPAAYAEAVEDMMASCPAGAIVVMP